MGDANRLAAELGVSHLIIESDEMKYPEFVKDPEDKCYICKKSRFAAIIHLAAERGFSLVASGSNVDDQSDYRPGMRAIRELRVRSPLLEAGLSKADIRALSRDLGLSTWNKPAYTPLPGDTTPLRDPDHGRKDQAGQCSGRIYKIQINQQAGSREALRRHRAHRSGGRRRGNAS